MEVSNGAGRIGIERDQLRADPINEREGQGDADNTVQQIADGQPFACWVSGDPAFQKRVDRGAEVGAKDQSERRMWRHYAAASPFPHHRFERR